MAVACQPGGRTADAAGVRAELLATRRSLNEALDDRAARTAAGGDAAPTASSPTSGGGAPSWRRTWRGCAVADTQRDGADAEAGARGGRGDGERELAFVKAGTEAALEKQAKALALPRRAAAVAAAVGTPRR